MRNGGLLFHPWESVGSLAQRLRDSGSRTKRSFPVPHSQFLLLLGLLCTVNGCFGGATDREGLIGAGSTFINPLMTQWADAYHKAGGSEINYQSIGSGGGISALVNHTVDFADSEVPLNAEESVEASGRVISFPVVVGTECIAYNLETAPSGLRLTGPLIAKIFLGKVSRWNDPAIVTLNPSFRLPDEEIFVAHRSDGSGSTYLLTDYLSKVSPAWGSQVGVGKSVPWPVGLGGRGNEGVAGILKNHPDSIGYIELAYAVENQISYASIENGSRRFVLPSPTSGSAAAERTTLSQDMRASITDSPNADSYPITGFSYILVYSKSQKSGQLRDFLRWILTKGQSMTEPQYYSPVPEGIRKRELALLADMK